MCIRDRHSKSPQIHTLFSEQTGIALEYQAIEVPINEFASYVKLFSSQGGKGLNITVPFKEDAYSLCTTLTDRAEISGSVNTLRFDDDMNICGDTTDGQGLLNDLVANHNIRLEDKSILILGAGGTVKSILERLLEQKTKEIIEGKFKSSRKVVLEEFLEGEELSYFSIVDKNTFLFFGSAQDHKRVGEADTGPNTGGMGAYSPANLLTRKLEKKIKNKIIQPTLKALKKMGHPYKGFLYAGLMIVNNEPYLIEYLSLIHI